jgi:hypothetical protein
VEPMIKLDPGGTAPILSYNVPEPTSYSGRNFIKLDFDSSYFTDAVKKRPKREERTPLEEVSGAGVDAAVMEGLRSGFADTRLFPNVRSASGSVRLAGRATAGGVPVADVATGPRLAVLDADEVAAQLRAGKRLNIYTSMYGTKTYNYVPEPPEPEPRLYLVETYGLSSFLGSYGAGRTLRTFTLLPGEKTKISVKTYTKRETDAKTASSILDSFTEESADDFETSVQEEQSDKEAYQESFEYHAEAEASASWGWGSAKVSGGVKGGTNRAREEFSKNVSSATQKHAAKASAKRDVQINTSYEVKEETGEETSIERELQNINLSRTLNLIFRQMNQQFVTLLHLRDVRVAFFNGYAESRREVPISQLDDLLDAVVVDDAAKRKEIRDAVLAELENVFDYQDDPHAVIEERVLPDDAGAPLGDRYHRVRRDVVSRYQDPTTGFEVDVPGIILAATTSVLRTEGVIVEALLGQGEALDEYAKELQTLEVRRREAEVTKLVAERDRVQLGNKASQDNDKDRAAILASLMCCPECCGHGNKPDEEPT